MKKLIVLLIAVSMLVTFASCKKEAEKENSESASPEVTEATKGDSEAADTTATDTTAADTTAADTTAADTTAADTTAADTTAADTTAAETTAADTVVDDSDKDAEIEQEVIRIDTPYCQLCLPGDLKDALRYETISEDPYTVAVREAETGTEVYKIIFNSEAEVLLGTVIGEKENIVVYADFAELDPSDKNFEKLCIYQESVNTIMLHLDLEYEFVFDSVIEEEDNSTFDIPTSFTTLKYPAKWQGVVTIENTENAIYFSYNGVKIFDLIFDDENAGVLLGYYGDIPVSVESYTFAEAGLSESDYNIACEMQEDVNVIFQNLMADENFV